MAVIDVQDPVAIKEHRAATALAGHFRSALRHRFPNADIDEIAICQKPLDRSVRKGGQHILLERAFLARMAQDAFRTGINAGIDQARSRILRPRLEAPDNPAFNLDHTEARASGTGRKVSVANTPGLPRPSVKASRLKSSQLSPFSIRKCGSSLSGA